MISRQVKPKNGKSKTTYIFFFILNLWKWKRFLPFFFPQMTELRRTYLLSLQIFEKIIDKDSFA